MNKLKKTLNNNIGVIELILLALCISLQAMHIFDHDILWHFKLGEEIINTHKVSMVDTFSWQPGLVWIQHEWLYDIFIYLVIEYTDLIGFFIIYLFNMLGLFIVGSKIIKPKYNTLYVIICYTLLSLIPRNSFNRPAEFSVWFVMFIIYIYDKQFKYKRLLIALATLFFANFHGGIILTSMIIYMIMMFIDVFYEVINKQGKDKIINTLKDKIIDTLLIFLVGLINPSGFELYSISLSVSGFESTETIIEWKNLTLDYLDGILVLLIVVAFGYVLKKHIDDDKTFRLVGVGCALLVLSFVACKATLLFNFFIIFFGYKALEELLYDILRLDKISKENLQLFTYFVVSLLCLKFTLSFTADMDATFQEKVIQRQPDKIIEYLSENMGDDESVFNGYNEGQYLIWNDIKCFVDSRQFMYTKEKGNGSLDELNDISKDKQVLLDFIHKYDFDYIWINENYLLWTWAMQDLTDINEYELVVTDILDETQDDIEDANKHYLYRKVGD